ncbi:SOS response-associated peptidase [Paenibacillus lemnae]|uniref:Abasic site processing protein n=1 Tax=Paenibacillus lemnae TaxID=1330551 RepID=A0A848M1S3_PAELE|nr:SOS response-associated peptidase [Paenibacillus lemnae]NMO94201.1 SOS response-associated peptidase [Paenibacillus lemnae]
MCRRFSMSSSRDEISKHFGLSRMRYLYKSRYNISPTQTMPVVVMDQGERVLDEFRWGLVPYWGKAAVNADLHAVHENPTYRKTLDQRRCVIPCNGLYYLRTIGKKSYAVRVVTENHEPFGVAGLYESWRNAKGEETTTCTMLMTDANVSIREFESRMPAILSEEDIEKWLHPDSKGIHNLQPLLKTYDHTMKIYPVTPLVVNDLHDHQQCIEEMDLKSAWIKSV